MNSNIYPYVRTGDSRLSSDLSKLNSDQFTVSAVDGELATFIAAQDYPKAKLSTLPQTSSYAEVFLNIVNNKADVSFSEPSAANDFLKSNPGKIMKASENPTRTYGLSFAFARGSNDMVSMWNVALDELVKEGVISSTLSKYGVAADYTVNK